MSNMKYSAFQLEKNTFTRAGLPLEKAVTSLWTFIQEGEMEKAIGIAYDMYRTSTFILERLWKELFRIAVNIVGMAEPYALDYVYNLYRICYDSEPYAPESGGMMALTFIHAIRYLCTCGHDSSVCDSLYEVKSAFDNGETAHVPVFAYDHHNHEGRKLGHNPLDFLNEDGGSYVSNEVPGMAEPYKQRLRALLSKTYGDPDPKPFIVNSYNHFYEMESINGFNLELMQSAFQLRRIFVIDHRVNIELERNRSITKFINPLPKNTAEVLARYPKVIVAEQNNGQFANYLRGKVPGFEPYQFNRIKGQPFIVSRLVEEFTKILEA